MNAQNKTKIRDPVYDLVRYGDKAYYSSQCKHLHHVLVTYKIKLDNLFIEDHMRTLLGELRKNYERV